MSGSEHVPSELRQRRRPLLRWLAIGLLLLTCASLLAALLFTRSEGFNELLRGQVERLVDEELAGRLQLAGIEGSIWGELQAVGLSLFDGDERVLHVPRLRLRFAPTALLWGEVRIERLELLQPELLLARDAAGTWNLLRALAPASPSRDADPPAFVPAVVIRVLEVQGAGAELRGIATEALHVAALEAAAFLRITPRHLDLRLDRAAWQLRADDLPVVSGQAAGRYEQRPDGRRELHITGVSLESERSRLALSGVFAPSGHSDLSLEIAALAPEDIARIAPGLTLREALRGSLRVSGDARLRVRAELHSAGAELRADGGLSLADGGARDVRGEAKLSGLDLDATLVDPPLPGVLNADVSVADRELRFRAALQRGAGLLSGEGSLVLDDVPRYRFAARARDLDPASLLGDRPELAGRVSLRAQLEGSGRSLDTLEGRATCEVDDSRFGRVDIQSGSCELEVARGRLRIQALELVTRLSRVAVTGQAELAPDGALDLSLTGDTADAGPLLSLLDLEGAGRVEWQAQARGPRSGFALQGDARAESLHIEGFEAEAASLQLALEGLGGESPVGRVDAKLLRLSGRLAAAELAASLSAPGGAAQPARVELRAEGVDGGGVTLALDLQPTPEGLAGTLQRLEGRVGDETWQLVAATRIELRGESLELAPLEIASKAARLRARGRLGRVGEQSLALELHDVPLGLLSPLLPSTLSPSGRLDLSLALGGTAAAPTLDTRLTIHALALGSQPLDRLEASLGYRDARARGRLELHQDGGHRLTAEAGLPMRLAWSQAPSAEVTGDLELHAQSDGIDLAFLDALAAPHASGVAGELALDLRVRGPLEQPLPTGTLQLRAARMTPSILAVSLRDMNANASFDAEGIQIHSLEAAAEDGRLDAQGTLHLRQWRPQSVEATISVTNWPAIATRSYRARVDGELRAEGELSALSVDGQLRVRSGTLRPDLALLTEPPLPRDKTIVLARAPDAEPAPPPPPPRVTSPLYEGAAIRFEVAVERNLWVRHENAAIELSGALRVTKARHEDLELAGRIEAERGWVELQGRRFRMAEGEVVFTGGATIDPTLRAVARRKIGDYTIEAVVGGTSRAPTLELRSDPHLEQGDIVAVLLFGRPAKELEQGEQRTLAQQAGGIAASLGIKELTRSVENAMGLADVGIQIEELSEERAALGAYLGEKVYLTVSQELAGERAQRFTVEYEFWPGWSAVASSTTQGESDAGLVWKKRY